MFLSDILYSSFWNPQVSPSGRRKVIATGDIDIADYISEEPTSYDITVTLKPMTKNIVSGSMEFTLSSVMLEDGLPRWVFRFVWMLSYTLLLKKKKRNSCVYDTHGIIEM